MAAPGAISLTVFVLLPLILLLAAAFALSGVAQVLTAAVGVLIFMTGALFMPTGDRT